MAWLSHRLHSRVCSATASGAERAWLLLAWLLLAWLLLVWLHLFNGIINGITATLALS